MVFRPEFAGDDSCVSPVFSRLFLLRVLIAKGDRVRLHRPLLDRSRKGEKGAGVESAAEEDAERNVTNQMAAYGGAQLLPQLGHELALGAAVRGCGGIGPGVYPTLHVKCPVAPFEQVPG